MIYDRTISLRLDSNTCEQLDEFARATERTRSAVVRLLAKQVLRDWMDELQEGNDRKNGENTRQRI